MTVSEETARRIADALERLARVAERVSPTPPIFGGYPTTPDCGCVYQIDFSICPRTACPRRAQSMATEPLRVAT